MNGHESKNQNDQPEAVVYEYDLGMDTVCFTCGSKFWEGEEVVKDGKELFCSWKCQEV